MELNKNKDQLEKIKLQAISNMPSLIPEEGETISIYGGLGNKTLNQTKKENGKFFQRDNEESEWEEFDMGDKILRFTNRFPNKK